MNFLSRYIAICDGCLPCRWNSAEAALPWDLHTEGPRCREAPSCSMSWAEERAASAFHAMAQLLALLAVPLAQGTGQRGGSRLAEVVLTSALVRNSEGDSAHAPFARPDPWKNSST